jgi:hypothetical protein
MPREEKKQQQERQGDYNFKPLYIGKGIVILSHYI